jgi:hypothetical protein
VSCADLTGDGVDAVVTGAGPGGGPHVKLFDGASLLKGQVVLLRSFMAYDPKFTGGVFVAAVRQAYPDPSGQNYLPAIVTGAGPGGGPHVRLFDVNTLKVVRQFFATTPSSPAACAWLRGSAPATSPPARVPAAGHTSGCSMAMGS